MAYRHDPDDLRRLLLTFRADSGRSIAPLLVGSLALFVVGSFVFADPTPTGARISKQPTTTPTQMPTTPLAVDDPSKEF